MNHIDGVIGVLVLLGRHIAPTLVDRELNLETAGGIDVANLELGVEHLERAEHLANITGLEDALT